YRVAHVPIPRYFISQPSPRAPSVSSVPSVICASGRLQAKTRPSHSQSPWGDAAQGHRAFGPGNRGQTPCLAMQGKVAQNGEEHRLLGVHVTANLIQGTE